MSNDKTLFPSGDVGFEGTEPRRDTGDTFEEVMKRRFDRRSLLKGGALAAPLMTIGSFETLKGVTAAGDGLTFNPIQGNLNDDITVADGYSWSILAKYGDPIVAGAPEFDQNNLDAAAMRGQVGYNCDFIGWFDLPFGGIVAMNHEYTNPELIFPNYDPANGSLAQVEYEVACHGVSIFSVFPVRTINGIVWRRSPASMFNRRIHGETEILITGPAAGHPLMMTSYDGTGTMVRGTFNNCGGGITPWRTYLTAEENFDQYFGNGDGQTNELARAANDRFGLRAEGGRRNWFEFIDRFDVRQEPNEPNRFGWVVEIDPYDPDWQPRKRTAIGRFKHEAAATTLSTRGHAVVYSGDDARFEYMYKFVSDGVFSATDRDANKELLDAGTLYVAKFNDDGTGEWMPLIFGENGLDATNGFNSQAEVLLFARQAADVLGATQMDRPEDFEVNPCTGKVYCALTNNTRRTDEQVDAANPRANNAFGHIVEITETSDDAASETFRWEIFMLCGDPADDTAGTFFAGFDQTRVSKIANPDNLAFDRRGNMIIATDGQPRTVDINDGIFFVPTEGPDRGFVRQIFSGVIGCECASVLLNTQNNMMMVTIQHPGEGGTRQEKISNFPDGPDTINRPSIVAVTNNRPPYRIGA